MKFNILKTVLFSGALAVFTACVNDKPFDNNAASIKTTELVANKSLSAVVASATTNPTLYAADDVIEGYVTSSDETGNFYSTICFQTLPALGSTTNGFSVSADFKSFGYGFTPGRKVFIKLKGLYFAKVDGSLKLGSQYLNGNIVEVGRIANFDWDKYLFPSSTIVSESALVTTLTIANLNDDKNLNELIDIDNVQFGDNALARTLYDGDVNAIGGATNHTIVGVGTTNTSVFRTSSFASFARSAVPAGRGKIRGVLTKYAGTYQFYIRSLNDLKLDSPRVYTFPTVVNEGFQTFSVNQKTFNNYLNFSTEGTKDWTVKSGNWLEMSAFPSFSFPNTIEDNISCFVLPVDMTAANSFTFQIRVNFFSNKTGLKVYRTTDYVPGMKISDATLFDISGSFSIPSASTTAFASAGTYAIPASVTGNGYFVFEYTGTSRTSQPIVTTTVQIDNIVVN